MKSRVYGIAIVLILISCQLSAYASEDQTIEISVSRRDSLINICKKYLDDPSQWRRVARINRLADPDLILPGQMLKLPIELLKGAPADSVVTFLKGDVLTKGNANEEWHALHLNDVLRAGSEVRTGGDGAVEISAEDGTVYLMRSNTSLRVKTLKRGLKFFIQRLYLQTGRIISKIKAATGLEPRYEIQTPSAVTAARGTEFNVSVDTNNYTRAEVLEGTVDVAAMTRKAIVNEGEGIVVKMNEPPAQPRKLLPPPELIGREPLYRAMPLSFQFKRVEGASSYKVMLTRDRDARDVVEEIVGRPDERLDIFNVDDGVYYLRSLTVDDAGLEGRLSAAEEIKVRVNPLPPLMQSPADGAEFRGKSPAFRWLAVKDATHYHLQIAEDREFSDIVVDRRDITIPEFTADSLAYKRYNIRIGSVAADGYEGDWSVITKFELVPPPPSPPVEKPLVDDTQVHIRWRTIGEGITYHFQMAKDIAFSEMLSDQRVDQAEIVLNKPEKAGTYYVRTSSIDTKGYEGSFSTPQSFAVERKPSFALLGIFGVTCILLLLLL